MDNKQQYKSQSFESQELSRFAEQVKGKVRAQHQRAKTAHERMETILSVYGVSPERKQYTAVPAKGLDNLRKSAKKISEQTDTFKLFDDILVLKHDLNEIVQERKVLQSKIRYMESELLKKDRKYEELMSNSIIVATGGSKFAKLKEEDILLKNLKVTLKNKDAELKRAYDELEKIKQSMRYTRVSELEVEVKASFHEIVNLKRLLAHFTAGAAVIDGKSGSLNLTVDEIFGHFKRDQSQHSKEVKNLNEKLHSLEKHIEELKQQHDAELEAIRLDEQFKHDELAEQHDKQMELLREESQKVILKLDETQKALENRPLNEDLEKDLYDAKQNLELLQRLKGTHEQTIEQLRVKEELSNSTVAELQQQIKDLLAASEANEEAMSVIESQLNTRRTSFVHGHSIPTSPVSVTDPGAFQTAFKASRRKASVLTAASKTNGSENSVNRNSQDSVQSKYQAAAGGMAREDHRPRNVQASKSTLEEEDDSEPELSLSQILTETPKETQTPAEAA